MTASLTRWQVIPTTLVVFCYPSHFCHPSGSYATEGKKDNNNNNHDNVYSAVIMTNVTARVHLVHLQPVPKAVYCSSCRDQHSRPGCDLNLSPLTQQSDALTT